MLVPLILIGVGFLMFLGSVVANIVVYLSDKKKTRP